MQLFESELKVMNLLWEHGPMPAKELAKNLESEIGWKKNTTYTIIKKCLTKQAIKKSEPDYLCTPLITKEEIQKVQTDDLINKIFDGSASKFFAAFVTNHKLSKEEVESLHHMIEEYDDES